MGAARLGQAASDAVIVSLRRSLTWANTVTWPVWLMAHSVRIEGITRTRSSPHTPPSECGPGVFRQIGAADRIGLRSRARRFESCRGTELSMEPNHPHTALLTDLHLYNEAVGIVPRTALTPKTAYVLAPISPGARETTAPGPFGKAGAV